MKRVAVRKLNEALNINPVNGEYWALTCVCNMHNLLNNYKGAVRMNYVIYFQLERWWFDYAYLDFRLPVCPLLNFAGPGPHMNHCFPAENGTQIQRAGFLVHLYTQFWHLLRE